jgi:flagellar biosynthesis/type III secretory pathway chaperone
MDEKLKKLLGEYKELSSTCQELGKKHVNYSIKDYQRYLSLQKQISEFTVYGDKLVEIINYCLKENYKNEKEKTKVINKLEQALEILNSNNNPQE